MTGGGFVGSPANGGTSNYPRQRVTLCSLSILLFYIPWHTARQLIRKLYEEIDIVSSHIARARPCHKFPVAHAAVPKDMLVIGKAADPKPSTRR